MQPLTTQTYGTNPSLHHHCVLGIQQEAGRRSKPAIRDLPALLDGVQLTHDAKAPALPDPCVQCCLTAAADLHAVNTFVDAVSPAFLLAHAIACSLAKHIHSELPAAAALPGIMV